MKRYPLAALVEASGMSENALGEAVGLTGSNLGNARRFGLIEEAADRCACRLGLVPWLVWSDWLDDAGKLCAECGERFYPKRSDAKFCTPRCGNRQRQRAYWVQRYASDPEFAEKERARRRRYYIECHAYELASSRRRQALRPSKPNSEAKKAWNRAYYRRNRVRILAQKAASRPSRAKKAA